MEVMDQTCGSFPIFFPHWGVFGLMHPSWSEEVDVDFILFCYPFFNFHDPCFCFSCRKGVSLGLTRSTAPCLLMFTNNPSSRFLFGTILTSYLDTLISHISLNT